MVGIMNADITKLNKLVEQFCCSPSPLFLDETQTLLNELLKALYYEEDFLRRNKLEQLLGMIRRASETDLSTYAHVLHSIAFDEYDAGNNDYAEFLFRGACDLVDDNSLNNNLAYVLRRNRNDSINSCEVITLLLPGRIPTVGRLSLHRHRRAHQSDRPRLSTQLMRPLPQRAVHRADGPAVLCLQHAVESRILQHINSQHPCQLHHRHGAVSMRPLHAEIVIVHKLHLVPVKGSPRHRKPFCHAGRCIGPAVLQYMHHLLCTPKLPALTGTDHGRSRAVICNFR